MVNLAICECQQSGGVVQYRVLLNRESDTQKREKSILIFTRFDLLIQGDGSYSKFRVNFTESGVQRLGYAIGDQLTDQ